MVKCPYVGCRNPVELARTSSALGVRQVARLALLAWVATPGATLRPSVSTSCAGHVAVRA